MKDRIYRLLEAGFDYDSIYEKCQAEFDDFDDCNFCEDFNDCVEILAENQEYDSYQDEW